MTDKKESFSPTISIITVTYNAANELEQTIASVAGQSYGAIEFVVIDGKSNDTTRDVLQNYSNVIHYLVSEPDNGIYDAMNKGLKAATGDYVLFLNAGDYFCNDQSLENLVNATPSSKDVIYGDIMLVRTDGTVLQHGAKPFTRQNLIKFGTGVLCHQAILIRRELAPLYDTKFVYKGELNWYFDLFQKKYNLSCFHYKKPLVYYFLGGAGYQNFIANRLEWYKLLINRFGLRSVFNIRFMKFIYRDFQNRYGFFRKKID